MLLVNYVPDGHDRDSPIDHSTEIEVCHEMYEKSLSPFSFPVVMSRRGFPIPFCGDRLGSDSCLYRLDWDDIPRSRPFIVFIYLWSGVPVPESSVTPVGVSRELPGILLRLRTLVGRTLRTNSSSILKVRTTDVRLQIVSTCTKGRGTSDLDSLPVPGPKGDPSSVDGTPNGEIHLILRKQFVNETDLDPSLLTPCTPDPGGKCLNIRPILRFHSLSCSLFLWDKDVTTVPHPHLHTSVFSFWDLTFSPPEPRSRETMVTFYCGGTHLVNWRNPEIKDETFLLSGYGYEGCLLVQSYNKTCFGVSRPFHEDNTSCKHIGLVGFRFFQDLPAGALVESIWVLRTQG